MARLHLRLAVLLGVLTASVYSCGDSERKFVDDNTGGTAGEGGEGTGGSSGSGAQGGTSGSGSGGTAGLAGEGGEAGTTTGGTGPTGGTGGAGEGGEGGMVEPPPTVSPPGQNITSASGRMTGATYTLDVEIGFGYGQQRSASATYQLEANTAIKP